MLQVFNFLRSKVVQLVAVLGLVLLAFTKLRGDIREDAQEDLTREMEKADEDRAKVIRDRVADVPTRVQPTLSDTRGYRD